MNESVLIPPTVRHQICNEEDELLIIIELQYGNYLGEDDIVRYSDFYDRVHQCSFEREERMVAEIDKIG